MLLLREIAFADAQALLRGYGLALHLLDDAKAKCAGKVQGLTEDDAAALIPNTLAQILGWLGLTKS